MSAQQYMNLLQRQVNAGGCSDNGGAFTSASRIGLSEYQNFRALHPGLSRDQLSAMWAAHKTGGQLGGALLGGFPGQRAVYEQINRAHPMKSVRRDYKKAARDQYDMEHPNWRAERALYVRPARRAPPRSKQAAALYKQMRAMSLANPACAPFGLSAAERADYTRLRAVADQLGIPRSDLDNQQAASRARRAAKAAARAASASLPLEAMDAMDAILADYE